MSACTEACRARVECTTCHRIKAPVGRSVAAEMANGMCTVDCPGYHKNPAPGHMWPNEPLDDEAAPGAGGGKEGERDRT